MTEDMSFVYLNLDQRSMYEGIAEEAAEVAKAALKVIRAIDGDNPTPVSAEEAVKNLREEILDLNMYAMLLTMYPSESEVLNSPKWKRWVRRICERVMK